MRKLLMMSAALGLAAVFAGSRSASADPTLFQIMYTGYTDSGGHFHAGLDPGATFIGQFSTLNPIGINHVHVQDVYTKSSLSGSETFGWYSPVNATNPTLNALGTNTPAGVKTFITHTSFGLYMSFGGNNNVSPFTWYSQSYRNVGDQAGTYSSGPGAGLASNVHELIFKSSRNNQLYVAFDDQFFGGDSHHHFNFKSDGQFEDMVLRVEDAKLAPVPEPAFLQLGVLLCGGGLMAATARLRRRNKK